MGVGVPPNAAASFGEPSGAAGPCITEPEDGTLFPNNWLRPRVRVPGSTGLLKIKFHADKEANDLVAYTFGETWAMPKSIWDSLAKNVFDADITVTVQVPTGGVSTVKFRIAPVGAGGKMVFWSADPASAGKMIENMTQTAIAGDSTLRGFAVGDESTIEALRITDIDQQVSLSNGKTQGSHCIGCHTGTPDGNYVSFVDSWPWPSGLADIRENMAGSELTGYPGGICTDWNNCTTPKTFVQFPWTGPMTFSRAHWSGTERVGIMATQMVDYKQPWAIDNWRPGRLTWVNFNNVGTIVNNGQTIPAEGMAYGYLQTTGDPHPAAAFPTWSNDGNRIVYSSTACPMPGQNNGCGTQDGRLSKGATDLLQIPYAAGLGGRAIPVGGAATTTAEEYYPAFGPDDRLLAFTRVPAGDVMYANEKAEIYVVPSTGATAGDQVAREHAAGLLQQGEPGDQQPLAEVVAGLHAVRRAQVLLARLLVEPLRVARREHELQRLAEDRSGLAALRHGGRDRRDQHRRPTPRSISGTSRRIA